MGASAMPRGIEPAIPGHSEDEAFKYLTLETTVRILDGPDAADRVEIVDDVVTQVFVERRRGRLGDMPN